MLMNKCNFIFFRSYPNHRYIAYALIKAIYKDTELPISYDLDLRADDATSMRIEYQLYGIDGAIAIVKLRYMVCGN